MSEPSLELVHPIYVDTIWPEIVDGIEEACHRSGDDITAPYLWQECRSSRAMLFIIPGEKGVSAAVVARVETWGAKRVLRVLAACGKGMKQWLPALTEYRKWIDHHRCEKIVFDGRIGWKKALPKARVLRAVYEMDASDDATRTPERA